MLAVEVQSRRESAIRQRLLEARFPETKTLDQYARADGLINPTGTGISQDTPVVDWPYAYRDEYDIGTYPSSVNAQRYQALVLMAKIAAVLGEAGDSAASSR